MMNDLSDLDLVAQAMGIQNPPPNQSNHIPSSDQPRPTDHLPTQSSPSHHFSPPHHPALPQVNANPEDPLSNLDLSTLTPSDRQALQPILDALALSGPNFEDGDDLRISELLAQMNAAGEVADDLEGKLDRLLENLGKVEEEIGRDLPGVTTGANASGGDGLGDGIDEKKE